MGDIRNLEIAEEEILEILFWSYAEVAGATKEDGFQYALGRIYDDMASDWLRHDKELQDIFGSDRDTFQQYPWCVKQLSSFNNLESLMRSETPSEAAIRVNKFVDYAVLWRTDIIAAEEVKFQGNLSNSIHECEDHLILPTTT